MLGSRLTLTYLTFWLTYQSSAKVYEPCALYNELIQQHGQTEEVAAQLLLLAERTGYNTEYYFIEATNITELKLGIFGLKSHQVCSLTKTGGACNSNCRNFMDTDIRDDISCARKVMDKMEAKLTLFDRRRYHQCMECSFCPLRKTVECQERSFNPFNPQKDVIVASFQHTALLGFKNRVTNKLTVECTGSLITEDTILITASCMHKTLDLVYLGDLKLHNSDVHKKDLQFIEIVSRILHPNYNFNGVALIKLKRKAKLSQTVMTACIWMEPKQLKENTTLTSRGNDKFGSISQLDLKIGCCNMFPFIVGTESLNFSDYIEWMQQNCPDLPRSHIECASQSKEIDDIIYHPTKNDIEHVQGNVFGEELSANHVIGVAISDRFVLTSAQLLQKISKPERVHLGEAYFLETIYYHPDFNKQKPARDDVALIKLKDKIEEGYRGQNFDPFCVTSNPMDTGGALTVDAIRYDNTLLQLQYQDNGSNLSVCRKMYSKEFNFDDINPDNILCFDIPMIYVPGSCSIAVGSPIYTELGEMNFKNLKGFVLYNKDCGPIIATKIFSYMEWINKVVMSG